jgi:hypothetical protein
MMELWKAVSRSNLGAKDFPPLIAHSWQVSVIMPTEPMHVPCLQPLSADFKWSSFRTASQGHPSHFLAAQHFTAFQLWFY